MHSSNTFNHISVAKTSQMLTSREFNTSALPKFSFLRYSSKSPINTIRDELKIATLEKDTSSRNLGPGSYDTKPTASGPSFNFGYAPRFKLKQITQINLSKSTDKIKQNRNTEQYQPINKNLMLQDKFAKKRRVEYLNKETKEILDSDRKERIKTQIAEKIHMIEVRKHRTIRNAITQTYTMLMIVIMASKVTHSEFLRTRIKKNRVNRYLSIFAFVCRAVGKFIFSHRAVRYKLSWIVLKRHMPRLIQAKQVKIQQKFYERVTSIIQAFIKSGSIPKINLLIHKKTALIQRHIKLYLKVRHARVHAIKLFWDLLDKKAGKIPGHIRNYYICKYISRRISEFNKEKYKIHEFFVFLTSKESEHKFHDVFKQMQDYQLPIFRIYNRHLIKNFINAAYSEKSLWPEIRFPDFPVEPRSPSPILPNIRSILRRQTVRYNTIKLPDPNPPARHNKKAVRILKQK